MKKCLILAVAVALLFAFTPAASAAKWSNPEKNIGNVAAAPFKALGSVLTGVAKTVTLQEPKAILGVPTKFRQEVSDGVESAIYRLPLNKEATAKGELGAVSKSVDDAGLNWLADGLFYGVTVGCFTHEGVQASATHHYLLPWKAAAWTAGGVVAADVADAALNK